MATLQLYTKPEVKHVLPEIVIKHLWNLVRTGPDPDAYQFFVLLPETLGVGDLQEITHSLPAAYYSRTEKVFGFPPCHQIIEIIPEEDTMVMTLSTVEFAIVV